MLQWGVLIIVTKNERLGSVIRVKSGGRFALRNGMHA
jgi:hypothetical protein